MSNYELYEKVIETNKSIDNGAFVAAARNWVSSAEEVDFKNDEANELFFAAKRHCMIWCSNAINARVSKLRMVDCVKKIAEMNLPNPYPETSTENETKKIEENKTAVPVHVLGVVPELNKKSENSNTNKLTEKQPVESDNTEKRIFGKRSKR